MTANPGCGRRKQSTVLKHLLICSLVLWRSPNPRSLITSLRYFFISALNLAKTASLPSRQLLLVRVFSRSTTTSSSSSFSTAISISLTFKWLESSSVSSSQSASKLGQSRTRNWSRWNGLERTGSEGVCSVPADLVAASSPVSEWAAGESAAGVGTLLSVGLC